MPANDQEGPASGPKTKTGKTPPARRKAARKGKPAKKRATKEQVQARHQLAIQLCVAGHYSQAEGYRFYETIKNARVSDTQTGLERYGEMSLQMWSRAVRQAFSFIGKDYSAINVEERAGESLSKIDALIRTALDTKKLVKVRRLKPNRFGQMEDVREFDAPNLAAARGFMALRMKLLGQMDESTKVAVTGGLNIAQILEGVPQDIIDVFNGTSSALPPPELPDKPGIGGKGRLFGTTPDAIVIDEVADPSIAESHAELLADIEGEGLPTPSPEEQNRAAGFAPSMVKCAVCDADFEPDQVQPSGACVLCAEDML